MKTLNERRLSSLSAEIDAAGAELAILRERLEERRAATIDLELRAMASETPKADHDLLLAVAERRRVEDWVRVAAARLAGLLDERDRLLGRVGRTPGGNLPG